MVGRYPFLFPSVYRTCEHSIQYTYFLFRCRCGKKFNHWVLSVLVPQYQNHIFIRQRSYEIHANSFQRPFWSLLMVLYDLKVWLLGIQYIYQHIIPLLHSTYYSTWAWIICLVRTIPWCPSCAICIICFCNFSGITIHSPRIINPSTNVNSEKNCPYAIMSAEFPIRPFSIHFESLCNVGSPSTVSSLPIACGMLFGSI